MIEQHAALWNSSKTVIEQNITPALYITFYKESDSIAIKDKTLYVKVNNDFSKNYCNKHSVLSLNAVKTFTNVIENVVFITSNEVQSVLAAEEKSENEPAKTNSKTFDTFVIGKNNQFAQAAASAVADHPSKSYNPLFIYGKSGVGKTHLMQAICAKVNTLYPSLNVLYVTAEEFTSDFVEAVRFNRDGDYRKNENFKKKYRSADMLLVDDIQFIAGKKETQEEFFNTFNFLTSSSKQIVLTSDRHPHDIETLEKRIRSRFDNGLICDIQPPDYETRLAILHEKTNEMMLDADNDSLSFIAEVYTSGDVRELEGVLKKISFTSQLSNKEINLSFTQQCLGIESAAPISGNVTIAKIKQVVSDYFNISITDLESQQRKRTIAFPRHVAIYLTKKMLGWELKKISEEFGGRNHSTIINSITVIEKCISSETQEKAVVDKIEDLILKS